MGIKSQYFSQFHQSQITLFHQNDSDLHILQRSLSMSLKCFSF